jgi:hypothetical protein
MLLQKSHLFYVVQSPSRPFGPDRRREQNRHNFNGKTESSSVYRRPKMNRFQYMVNQIELIIVKDEKIAKKNTRKARNPRNTHLIFCISLFLFTLRKEAQKIKNFQKHTKGKKHTKHTKSELWIHRTRISLLCIALP